MKGDINRLYFERMFLGGETRLEADVGAQTIGKYTLVLGSSIGDREGWTELRLVGYWDVVGYIKWKQI